MPTAIWTRDGNWYVGAESQYHNWINGKLVAAQIADGVSGTDTCRNNDVWVGRVGSASAPDAREPCPMRARFLLLPL
jgi:hypothetical protein